MVDEILKKYETKKENLISILHDIQNTDPQNYLSQDNIKKVAKFLNISLSEIFGVISFYTMFSTKPRGKYIIKICRSTACHINGAGNIIKKIKEKLNINVGETTKDGLFILEQVGCLGLCGMAPAMMINDNVYGNLTDEKIDLILEEVKSGEYKNESYLCDKLLKREKQTLNVLENMGKIDPFHIDNRYKALEKAIQNMTPETVLEEVKNSGLRGRGGAGFPTGLKWSFTVPLKGEKYILCNADEGEPGTFKDRPLLEGDPHKVIEGIILAGYAIGASKGYIYIRGEYQHAIGIIKKAIAQVKEKGFLGKNILGSDFSFDIDIKIGAGSYVVGEETAQIESLEGKRGNPRIKPPFPGVKGIYQIPTVVNNVETLANIPNIVLKSADWFKGFGTEKSCGTKIFGISGKTKNTGLVEAPFGITLRELIFDFADGVKNDKKIKGALVGGAAGVFIPEYLFDEKISYENFSAKELTIGSGAIKVLDEDVDILDLLINIMEFFTHESCGKCFPCRAGNPTILNLLKKIKTGKNLQGNEWKTILKISQTMKETSLCALGQSPIMPLSTAYKYFKDELKK
ncbi:NADH-quinone oxidoreductase subunit NuoE [bacterium]|nr:NADH-quinone oxidoreductase subunit NuoE [bacterium]